MRKMNGAIHRIVIFQLLQKAIKNDLMCNDTKRNSLKSDFNLKMLNFNIWVLPVNENVLKV